ncbi:hypothetical protein [Streptomyces fractus]|uniref:hypothetical protein n=1 Tax=Streptomyces fractus TaxID=641806 RepID=UPI003CF19F29
METSRAAATGANGHRPPSLPAAKGAVTGLDIAAKVLVGTVLTMAMTFFLPRDGARPEKGACIPGVGAVLADTAADLAGPLGTLLAVPVAAAECRSFRELRTLQVAPGPGLSAPEAATR